ncbi:MAG: hypothetical protein WDN49_04750 [Acetobacteraceae bacterium]
MLHDIGAKHNVTMRVDEAKADIVPTVSSIDLKTYPGSMAAIAKILNHMGASWTFRTDGFDADNVSLTAGDRAGQRAITLGIIEAAIACGAENRRDAGMRALLHGDAVGGGQYVRQGSAVPGPADHRAACGWPGRRPHPREQGLAERDLHDACQLSRRGGATAAPRAICKRSVSICTRRKMPERRTGAAAAVAGLPSSSGRSHCGTRPSRSSSIRSRRLAWRPSIRAAPDAGKPLDHGGKATSWNKTVASLLELVADNLKD